MRGVKGTGPFGQKKGTKKKASKKARRQIQTPAALTDQQEIGQEGPHQRYGGTHPHSDCIAEAASADTLLSMALTIISILRKIPILRLQRSDVMELQEVTQVLANVQAGIQEVYGDLPTSAFATEEEDEIPDFDPRRTQAVSPGQLMRIPGPFGDMLRMMSQSPMRPMRTNRTQAAVSRGSNRRTVIEPEYVER